MRIVASGGGWSFKGAGDGARGADVGETESLVMAGRMDEYRIEHFLALAGNGELSAVKLVVASGCEVGQADGKGRAALMKACSNGRDAMVDFLIGSGCDVDAVNCYGMNALLYAASGLQLGCLNRLLAAGARIDIAAEDGATALMLAVRGGLYLKRSGESWACMDALLRSGCSLDQLDEQGLSALDHARALELVVAVAMLEAERECRELAAVSSSAMASGHVRRRM